MKALFLPLAAALLVSPAVQAACTPDEITAKAEQLAERVNQLTQNDPERARQLNEEIRQDEDRRTAEQLGDECEAYDRRMRQLEEAERQGGMPSGQ